MIMSGNYHSIHNGLDPNAIVLPHKGKVTIHIETDYYDKDADENEEELEGYVQTLTIQLQGPVTIKELVDAVNKVIKDKMKELRLRHMSELIGMGWDNTFPMGLSRNPDGSYYLDVMCEEQSNSSLLYPHDLRVLDSMRW